MSVPRIRKKTYQEHLQYLHEIVKLKLWFVWNWLKNHPEETVAFVLRKRVDIYRKTDINKGPMNPGEIDFECPLWLELENKAEELFEEHRNDIDASRFEEQSFVIFRPAIDTRSKRDFAERPYVLDYQCGSLKYDKPPEENQKCTTVHIANAISPYSIFDDTNYLPGCLLDVMKKSSAEYGADSMCSTTWLNSYDKWISIFPAEWKTSMGPEITDIKWHFGFWGQFMTARGTFNEHYGKIMRKTGKFPFAMRRSWCTFESLRDYLNSKSAFS
jgi:hypothetical protein